MKNSIIIVLFFTAGVITGVLRWMPEILLNKDLTTYALYILMFIVGIGIGGNTGAWTVLKKVNVKIILVPLTVVIGTYLGMFLLLPVLTDYSAKELLAVGSGFGYYSLSSIFIKRLHGDMLSTLALLANVMREISTLLFAPLLLKYFGKLAPIVSGGATSMDSTLPIITHVSGKEYAIISLFNGIVLTIAVPFLVTLILSV